MSSSTASGSTRPTSQAAIQWPDLPRQPVPATPGKASPVVCGRRFCACCGRWRHLVDFPHKYDEETRRHRPYPRCTACRKVARVKGKQRRRGEYNPRTMRSEVVSSGPFLVWLDRWRQAHEVRFDGSSTGSAQSVESLTARAGVSSRIVRRARITGRISYGIVDKLLIAAGGETMLWELYPVE